MQREQYNLNQHAHQLDVREAHLCRHECRGDRREAKIHAARMRGTDTRRVDQSRSKDVVCIIYFKKMYVRFSSDTTRLVIKCSILHAII
jgi:hypothetical protein